jgi:tetraacyldisaccharide 4'-kinase
MLPTPIRLLLTPLGWLYGCVAKLRVIGYQRGWLRSHRPPMPTLSIGNLSAGGTGKTPLLLNALQWLQQHDADVAVLSRGYGGDEGRIVEQRYPKTKLIENPNRVQGLEQLQQQGGAEVILLDDGFQHLRLQRDIDVVVVDATQPLGACLPAGLLREFPSALRRASVIVLSRTELVEPAKVDALWQKIERIYQGGKNPQPLPRIEGGMGIHDIRNLSTGETRPPESLQGMTAFLTAGVGNPQSFAALCRGAGVEISGHEWKADHYAWISSDCIDWNRHNTILVTEKDGVKLQPFAGDNVWEVRANWQFHRGQEDWEELLNMLYLPVRAAHIEPLWTAHDPGGRCVP